MLVQLLGVLAAAVPSLVAARPPDTAGNWTKSGLWYVVKGKGPAMVLVHGSNVDSRSFDLIADSLARDHRVLLTDLRLHGKSRDPGGPISWENDLLEVMDAAKVRRGTLLGHSLGSQIVVDFALAHPNRVDRLILVGPAVSGYVPTAMPAGFEPMMEALKRGDADAAALALAGMPAMQLVSAKERQAFATQLFKDNAALFKADRTRLVLPKQPAMEQLEGVKMPVLILVGDADLTEGAKVAAILVQRVPHARLVTLGQCGHLAPIDCPEQVAHAVLAYLQR